MIKNATKPLLTISILISNRPETIPKCLDSLQPIREAISSELILVDTSKNPDIHKMLLEYTDLVYEFEWCKDFSKARNVGLNKARGKWFMFLDDDEWFVDSEEIIKFFKSDEYKQYGCANYIVRNFFDEFYTSYSDGWGTRLYEIGKGSAFHSKIHEYMAPIRGKKKHIESMVYHSGYIFTTKEQQREHYLRNSTLLYEMIEQEPQNMRWKMQLVQEYANMGEKDLLEEFCKSCIDDVDNGNLKCEDSILCCFYAGYLYGLVLEGNHRKVIDIAEKFLQDERCVDIFKWQLYYRILENAFWCKDWKKALKYGKMFIDVSEDPQKREIVRQFQNTVLLLGEVFNPTRINPAYIYFISADLMNKSTKYLNEFYDKINWKYSNVMMSCKLWRCFLDTIEVLEYEDVFGRFIEDACKVTGFGEILIAEAESRKEKEAYKKIAYAFAQADSEDSYVLEAKIQDACLSEDIVKIQQSLQECFGRTQNALFLCEVVSELIEKYQIDIYSYLRYVGADQWKTSVRSFLADPKRNLSINVIDKIEGVFGIDDWRVLYYEMYLSENQYNRNSSKENLEIWVEKTFDFSERYLKPESEIIGLDYQELQERKHAVRLELLEKQEESSYEDLELRFHHYMLGTIEYYLAVYRDEAFEGDLEILPPEARAAVWLNEFFGKEEDDWEGKIATLRECARACQSLGEKIKIFAKFLADQREVYEERMVQNANSQLKQMVEMMKDKIQQMIDMGLKREALEVLKQVRALAPEDQELIEIEKKI